MATPDPFATSPLRGFGLITGVTATEGPLNPDELRVHPLGGPKPFPFWLTSAELFGTPREEVEVRFPKFSFPFDLFHYNSRLKI
jgi:hypothetical protein